MWQSLQSDNNTNNNIFLKIIIITFFNKKVLQESLKSNSFYLEDYQQILDLERHLQEF